MATRNADVLLLGCGNVGKSHILRYLRKITYGNDNNNNNNKFNNDMDKIPSLQSQSTVGVEIDVLRLNGIHPMGFNFSRIMMEPFATSCMPWRPTRITVRCGRCSYT